ncbi:MAG: PDZ domain-containing protein [Promethearchaeia archaeon]
MTEIVPNGAAYKSGRICVDDVFVSIDGHHGTSRRERAIMLCRSCAQF